MIKIYRDKDNKLYWDKRWESAGVDKDKFFNEDIYPIKYANMVVHDKNSNILEAGCGAGRVFFHYKNMSYNIKGLEYSQVAVNNIKAKDPQAEVVCGSITNLPYPDYLFDVVLAFGLYHNIEVESELDEAFKETSRVLKSGGHLLASVRFDSLENNIIEYVVRKRKKGAIYDKFHRLHFSKNDLVEYLNQNNLIIEKLFYARNVSFLFKFDIFRSAKMKTSKFNESEARSGGFRLNLAGIILDTFLHKMFPRLFSNIIIVIARKI